MSTWLRLTEWPEQHRATWALGVLGRVMASGKARCMAEARRTAAPLFAALQQQVASLEEQQ